jgi:hypothetical protein
MHLGCFVLEALLQSILECLYNQTCINILQLHLTNSSLTNISADDSSLLIRHNENSTLQKLVNDLMIEDWNLSNAYESYYEGCQPTQCSYTYMTKNDVIYIATSVFGLVGGLAMVLRLVLPRLVRLIASKTKKKNCT